MKRHCSVCHLPGHDARRHRNPEFVGYPPHPIRNGKGVHKDNGVPYSRALAGDPIRTVGELQQARQALEKARRRSDEADQEYASTPSSDKKATDRAWNKKQKAAHRAAEISRNIRKSKKALEEERRQINRKLEQAERVQRKLQARGRKIYEGVDDIRRPKDRAAAMKERAPKYAALKKRQARVGAMISKLKGL